MDIMHMVVHEVGGNLRYSDQDVRLTTKTRIGMHAETCLLYIYVTKPLGLFCLQVKSVIPGNQEVHGLMCLVVERYRVYRAGVWYRRGMRHSEMLKRGETPKELPWST